MKELIGIRTKAYVDSSMKDLNSKGELTENKKKEIKVLKKQLIEASNSVGTFEKINHKNVNINTFFEHIQARKSLALNALREGIVAESDDVALKLDEKEAYLINQNKLQKLYSKYLTKRDGQDDDLIKSYPELIKILNLLGKHSRSIEGADEVTEEWVIEQKRLIRSRMDVIVAHGYTAGEALYQDENIVDKSVSARKELLEEKKKREGAARPGFLSELRKQLIVPDFSGKTFDERGVYQLLNALSEIRRFKEQSPDMYRLGQKYEDYLRCEVYIKNEDLLRETFELRLRMLHLDDKFEFSLSKDMLETDKKKYAENLAKLNSIFSDEEVQSILTNDAVKRKAYVEKQIRKEFLTAKEKQESIIADLKEIGIPDAEIEILQKANSVLLLNNLPKKEEPSYEVAKKTLLKDVESILDLIAYKDLKEDRSLVPDEDVPYDKVIDSVRFFSARYYSLKEKIGKNGGYSDRVIADSRSELEELSRMADFLKASISDTKLNERIAIKYADNPEYSLDIERINEIKKISMQLDALYCYSNSIWLKNTPKDIEDLELYHKGKYEIIEEEKRSVEANLLRSNSEKVVSSLRRDYQKDSRKDEIIAQEKRVFIIDSVGRELTASLRRNKINSFSDFISMCTNQYGNAMQLLSWLMREKRTDKHGMVNYEECKNKYDNTLAKITEFKEGKIRSVQNGDAGAAPKVELEKYFSSQLKKDMIEKLNVAKNGKIISANKLDEHDSVFGQAVEAIEYYSSVVGIINTDTTEMEMAFIDTFKKKMMDYITLSIQRVNEADTSKEEQSLIRERLSLLSELNAMFDEKTKGTLEETLDKDVFEQIAANATEYIEDTVLTTNMEKSNIKDIPLFLHEPNLNDIKQSTIGDCWLLGSLTAVLKTNPDFIRSMFSDLGDGSVLVRLYTPVDKYGRSIEKKEDMFNPGINMVPAYFKLRKHYETGYGNASDCTWVQLLEKAVALGGLNYSNAVRIKGNKLYNVANELTAGSEDAGVAILTGHAPRKMLMDNTYDEGQFLANPAIIGYTAGLSVREEKLVKDISFKIYTKMSSKVQSEKFKYVISDLKDAIMQNKNDRMPDVSKLIDDFIVEELKSKSIDAQPNAELKTQILTELWEKIQKNIDLMRDGKKLEFSEAQYNHERSGSENPQEHKPGSFYNSEKSIKYRAGIANYFVEERIGFEELEGKDVDEDVEQTGSGFLSFVADVKYCLEKKGTVALGGGHCISVLDIKYENGKYYMLMRDPFNIYNISYEKKRW